MKQNKIIFTGPVGAGKTTAIAALSDVDPITTDEDSSDRTRVHKPSTTVAMDYGLIKLGDSEHIHLYGTPGQERFDFMWDILVQGGIGLVLLINNTRPAPLDDLRFFLDSFEDFIAETGVAVGITQTDLRPTPSLDEYYRALEPLYPKAPLFTVDARRRDDVSILLEALLCTLDPVMAV